VPTLNNITAAMSKYNIQYCRARTPHDLLFEINVCGMIAKASFSQFENYLAQAWIYVIGNGSSVEIDMQSLQEHIDVDRFIYFQACNYLTSDQDKILI
jgi:hypothetical protein